MITVKTLASSSKGNAYLLESGGKWLLVECGIPYKTLQEKLDYQVSRLDGCLVTHSHGDHARCMPDLVKAGIGVYCTEETFKAAAPGLPPALYQKIEPNRRYFLGGWKWSVQPFETVHDAPGSVGFVISDEKDSLVFITDTAYCKYTFPFITILMIEANYSEEILAANIEAGRIDPARAKRVRENHLSIERVIELLRANDRSRLREVRLLHLSDGNSDEALFKEMVKKVVGVPVCVESGGDPVFKAETSGKNAACIAAKQAYLAEIAAIDNVSRATWWANGKGEKLLADLGGKDGECYLAVMEHLDKKQKELKAALKRKS